MSAPAFPPAVAQPDAEVTIEFDDEAHYKYACTTCCICLPVSTMCIGLLCLPILPCWFRKEIASRHARITDKRIEFEGGWLNHISKSIPLDRVQDVTVDQRCNEKCFGIKSVAIQTAGSGRAGPELLLLAPKDPEMIRDIIMDRRDRLVLGPGNGNNGTAAGAGIDGLSYNAVQARIEMERAQAAYFAAQAQLAAATGVAPHGTPADPQGVYVAMPDSNQALLSTEKQVGSKSQ